MTNKAGTTTAASTVTESGDNALITIPAAGYYSTTSKISVPISEINGNNQEVPGVRLVLASNSNSGSVIVIPVKYYSTLTVTVNDRSTVTLLIADSQTNTTIKSITSTGTFSIDISEYEFIHFYVPNSTGVGYVTGLYSLS